MADWTTPSAVHSKCGETDPYLAILAIDDNTATYWKHNATDYHWIIFDMGSTLKITQIRIYFNWGAGFGCTVYVSDDPENWGDPVFSGALTASGSWYLSGTFDKNGRYIKLVCLRNEVTERMYEFDAMAEAVGGPTLKDFADVGHGIEAFNTPFRAMNFSDVGLGSDSFAVLLSKAFADAGLGSDVFTKEVIGFIEKAFADSGMGTDAFNIPFKALLFVDAGQGVDSFNIPFKAIMFSDTGHGVDVFVIPFKTMSFSDVANGVDVFALLRELAFSDVGGGVDSFAKTLLEIVSKAFTDAGLGSDTFLAKHIHKLKLPFLIGMTLDGQLVWIFKQEYDVE